MDKPSISRGLDAILKLQDVSYEDLQKNLLTHDGELKEIPINFLHAGKFQPRKNFNQEDLQALANSIAVQGIIQPLIVRLTQENNYEIIAGERRWRAAKQAGLTQVPVIIRHIDDEVAAAFSLIENIQRKDLNPLEEALALQRLSTEFDLSHDEVAKSVGRSRTAVTNILRLLTLDEDVKQALNQGAISMGHARALVTLKKNQQQKITARIISKHLSVRQTEELVRSLTTENERPSSQVNLAQANLSDWQQQLRRKLNTNTVIKALPGGQYQVNFKVKNIDELNQLMTNLLALKN